MALEYSVTQVPQLVPQPSPGGEWTIENNGTDVVYYRTWWGDTMPRASLSTLAVGALKALVNGYIAINEGVILRADQKNVEVVCIATETATLRVLDGAYLKTA